MINADEIAGIITMDDLLVMMVSELATIAVPAAEAMRGSR